MALLLRLRHRIPYVCYVHGEDVGTAAKSREQAFLVRRVFRNARGVIANSHNTAALLQDRWKLPAERVRVLHPGVDVDLFAPAPPDGAVRRQLGWQGRTVILTVGRLQLRKGQDQMIRALARVRQSFPDVLYAIIGDGEQRVHLAELARAEGVEEHVQFRGETCDAELIRCYQQCDLFVLPNREINGDIEGFGMVLLEAQACGRTVVAGVSGGTADTMRAPQTGRLVRCDRPEPLAELVTQLLGDAPLRRQMGEAGRAWVEEHFSWDALSREAAALFQEQASMQTNLRSPSCV